MEMEIKTLDDDTVQVASLVRENMIRLYATNGRHGASNHYLSPAQTRELAAALLRAADEAEAGDTYPTVRADELRKGDVLNDTRRVIRVADVRRSGNVVYVRWVSDVGGNWEQGYASDASMGLRTRGPVAWRIDVP